MQGGPGKASDSRIWRLARTEPFTTGIGETFQPAARYTTSLIKLVPTDWGPPTFEIDGIKMLPTAQVSPYADAERKVELIRAARQGDPGHLRRPRLFRRVVSAGAGERRSFPTRRIPT